MPQNVIDEYNKELVAIKNAIDGIYKQEIYQDEYNHTESKYIIKEPMIHLKNNFNLKNISLNFPIEIKLQDSEYIIKHYIIMSYGDKINNEYYDGNMGEDLSLKYESNKYIYAKYITNYGRILVSDNAEFFITKLDLGSSGMSGHRGYSLQLCLRPTKNIFSNKLGKYSIGCELEYSGDNVFIKPPKISSKIIEFNLIEQPKLYYRMPKLFLDVMDAFQTQNTDLMQNCCKTYLEISRESKVKESIMKDIQIKNIIKDKDEIIKSKDDIISEKNLEIDLLNKKLQELQEKYDKIKSMFN